MEDPYEFTEFEDEPFPEASLRASSRTRALAQSIKIGENKMKIKKNNQNAREHDKRRSRFKIRKNIELDYFSFKMDKKNIFIKFINFKFT